MNAIVATGYGGPEVLELQQVNKPAPAQNELLIRIYAASATTADGMMRTGTPYLGRLFTGLTKPKHPIPGTGFAGMVEATGSDVTNYKIGDRVFGETSIQFSTNAEYVCVPEDGIVLPLPEEISFTEAAPFCDGALTSLNFLQELGNVEPGQEVLINGASGSLGTAAVQLAKQLGATVTAVCSTRNVALVKSLGADVVIDYTKTDFTQGAARYHLVYDTIGKSSFGACKQILRENGAYLSPVLSLGLLGQMAITSKIGHKKARFAATGLVAPDKLRVLLAQLIELRKQGKLTTVIDRQYPLEKVGEAHTYIASGRKKGNVVITVHN